MIWNQSPRLMGFTSLSQIQHTFFLSLLLAFFLQPSLIFIDQPNLIIYSGVHSLLHANCHHPITHCKLNLKIVFHPPYERWVWNYKKADVTGIRKALDLVNWDFIFLNKTVHDQVLALDQVVMKMFTNYIPNKYNLFDDQDPPWMNDRIKSKI